MKMERHILEIEQYFFNSVSLAVFQNGMERIIWKEAAYLKNDSEYIDN